MNDDYKLKARYTKILTAKDLADRFSSDTQFKSKYKALSTSTLYNLLDIYSLITIERCFIHRFV